MRTSEKSVVVDLVKLGNAMAVGILVVGSVLVAVAYNSPGPQPNGTLIALSPFVVVSFVWSTVFWAADRKKDCAGWAAVGIGILALGLFLQVREVSQPKIEVQAPSPLRLVASEASRTDPIPAARLD